VTELERDFTFSLTKYPSLIFVFLVVTVVSWVEGLNLIFVVIKYGWGIHLMDLLIKCIVIIGRLKEQEEWVLNPTSCIISIIKKRMGT